MMAVILPGWGQFPKRETTLCNPRTEQAMVDQVQSRRSVIARGMGRAYGDSAISPTVTLLTRHLNRMLAFDPQQGQLTAEAGVTLAEVIATFLPRGWFPWVAPGTAQVTLGGAIAADVHGKNHVRDGSFRTCVDWVEVMGPDGVARRIDPTANPALFDHTLGGMGLTGVILRAAIRLRPVETGWLRQTTQVAGDLTTALDLLAQSAGAQYSVAWLDASTGRALVHHADHAARVELPPALAAYPPAPRQRALGFDLPAGSINGPSARALNSLYFHAGARRTGLRYVRWDQFFFPLDTLLDWNRLYGRRGLVQFQCVLPPDQAQHGLNTLLHAIKRAGVPPVLSVLKQFGAQDSAFSFPMQGVTLAVDFPATPQALALMDRLDPIVLDHGGRFYLAKDARLSAATLRASDPRADHFAELRAQQGLDQRFQSLQSQRLAL